MQRPVLTVTEVLDGAAEGLTADTLREIAANAAQRAASEGDRPARAGVALEVRGSESGLQVTPGAGHGGTFLRRRRQATLPAPLLLDDALATLAGRTDLDVVLVRDSDVDGRAIVDAVRRQIAPASAWIVAEDAVGLAALRDEPVRTVHAPSVAPSGTAAERHAHDIHRAGIDAVAIPHDGWTAGLVALYHRFGVLAYARRAHEPRNVRAAIALGVDIVSGQRIHRVTGSPSARPATP